MAKRSGKKQDRRRKVGNIKLVVRYSVILLLIFGLLAVFVIGPLFKTVTAAFVLSYVFYPLYSFVYSKLKAKSVSALLVTVFVLILLTVPSVFVTNKLSDEVFTGYIIAKQYLGGTKAVKCEGSVLCEFLPKDITEASPKVKAVLTDALGKGATYIFNKLTQTLLSLTTIVLQLFMILFIMYYMFKDGKVFVDKIKNVFPLKKQRQDALIEQFKNVASAVIYGTVLVALIQGILAGIGFYLFGVPSPIIWGMVTLMVSLVPFLGPFIVWVPASLLLMVSGYWSGDGLIFLRGVGLFLYGLLLVSGVDNVLKPKIIGRRAKVHPALVLLGVIGGINFFGIVGFIIGPVILAMFVTAIETYIKEKLQPSTETQ